MSKLLGLLAAAMIAFALPSLARANIGPLTLSPESSPAFAGGGGDDFTPRKLSIHPLEPVLPNTDFIVGGQAANVEFGPSDVTLRSNSPADMRAEIQFIRERITTPGFFDRLATLLDVDEVERPWSTTTTVHFMAAEPARGKLVPFATLAHEIDVNEDFERLGIGAGAMIILQKNISLGAEVIYLGSDRSSLNAGFNREALFMSRLQIEF
jgi:hypothetical protein